VRLTVHEPLVSVIFLISPVSSSPFSVNTI
jgi:hypothetical protein